MLTELLFVVIQIQKRKFVPLQTIKAYKGRQHIVPLINLGTRRRLVVSITYRPFYSRYPLTGSWVDTRTVLDVTPAGTQTLDCSVRSLVIIPTTLAQLSRKF